MKPKIDIWYGERQLCCANGQPQRFFNLVGNIDQPKEIVTFGCSVNGGTLHDLCIGPDQRRLVQAGDFNVEIDVKDFKPGMNEVKLLAETIQREIVTSHCQVFFSGITACHMPVNIDWGALSHIQQQAQIVDGRWAIEGGWLRTQEPGYDRLVAIGDMEWRDYEVTTSLILHHFVPTGLRYPSVGGWAGLVLRWQGHQDWSSDQPRRGWYPLGCIVHYGVRKDIRQEVFRLWGNNCFAIADDESASKLLPGRQYIFKARAETLADTNSRYSLKVWETGQVEPDDWLLQGFGPHDALKSGSLLLAAHQTDVSFGPVTVTSLH